MKRGSRVTFEILFLVHLIPLHQLAALKLSSFTYELLAELKCKPMFDI